MHLGVPSRAFVNFSDHWYHGSVSRTFTMEVLIMRKLFLILSLVALNAGFAGTVAAAEEKFDYDWAYDPLSHEPILVCVDCWFWSCDC